MEICVNNTPFSETQLPYRSDSDEHIVIQNIRKKENFVHTISINRFRCANTVCEIIIFAHSFYKDFPSIVSLSSEELEKSISMYGAFNPIGNTQYQNGTVKYYSPTNLSKICRQNADFPSVREDENYLKIAKNSESIVQEKTRNHHDKKGIEEKSRKKANKDKRRHKRESKDETSYEAYCMMTNQEDVERKEKKRKKDQTKEFSELNFYDLQCLMNDCNKDKSITSNIKKEKHIESKRNQRSHSIDQIPTKDVTSEQKIMSKPERRKSAERKEIPRIDKNSELHHKYYLPTMPSNSFQIFEQQEQKYINQNYLIPNQNLPKMNKEKSKNKKKISRDVEMPEFVTLDQINEQTMNIKDEKFEHHKHYRWETEKKVHHHQQREFYGEYNQQQYRHNLDSHYNEQDMFINPNEYNKIIEDHHQPMMHKIDLSKMKERKKEHKKKTSDKEYKALKKYIKKLAKEQQRETFHFKTEGNVLPIEPIQDKRVHRDRKYLEENLLNFDQEFNPNQALRNIDCKKGCKHGRTEFIPLDLGLDELQIPPRAHRKKHDRKNNKESMKSESAKKLRSTSLSVKKKHKNLNHMLKNNDEVTFSEIETDLKAKYKSETSLNSTANDKNIVCIYRNEDEKEDRNTIKLTKKPECLSVEASKKYKKKEKREHKEKKKNEPSSYEEKPNVFPIEHNKQMSDVLKMQERSLFFQKAMRKDFPSRPRPRLSRSRQRSSRYLPKLEDTKYNLDADEKPTKEVHCYDVGTSTILDNNFGDVLELLKGEPLMNSPCTNKKRSVFHVKKKASREDLIESARKACDDGDKTLGIVVKGIEPPKKFETSKVKSRFKFPSEKSKINKLECKILSVVAIAPSNSNNPDIEKNLIKTQSSPQMQHNITEKKTSDKRLERLLKYYKVEAQSKINNEIKPSQKSIKAIIATKLSDYLKKLEEDDNDEILQIQTDDPKVVKLILPIDLTTLEYSNSSEVKINDDCQIARKPAESFSDLYINYSVDNIDDDDDDLNSLELSKLESRVKEIESDEPNLNDLISNQSFNLKSNEQKSTIFLKRGILNFDNMESQSEFPVSPRMTENTKRGSEFEVIKEFSFDEKEQAREESSTGFLVQQNHLDNNITNNHRRQEHESRNNSSFDAAERSCNFTSKAEQSFTSKMENVEYKNSKSRNKRISYTKINANEIRNPISMKESYSAASRIQSIEKMFTETPQSNKDSLNNFQDEKKISKKLYNIDEVKAERNESAKIYHRLQYSYNEGAPNNEDFKHIHSDMGYLMENKEGETMNNSVENVDKLMKPPKRAPSQTLYRKHRYEFSEQKEHQNSSSGINTKITGIHMRPCENEQIFDSIYAQNSEPQDKTKMGRVVNSQAQKKSTENSPPTRGYEYFEIPPPRPKTMKKTRPEVKLSFDHQENRRNNNTFSLLKAECHAENLNPVEPKFGKNSQIPQRITNLMRNHVNSQNVSSTPLQKENFKLGNDPDGTHNKFYETGDINTWDYQNEENEINNSLEKCLHWNIRNSETVVMSEFANSAQNRTSETEKSTIVPRKSHIPVARKDQYKFQNTQGRSPGVGNENNTTMFLTKSYKVPLGQSSYERRKMYDTRIRKNVKRRSLSENSGQTKMLPLIYEVRYCNVHNQCLPRAFDLGRSRSDQNLSNFSMDFDSTDLKKSFESLTTAPSCYLKESKYEKDRLDLSTDPSCLLKESEYGQNNEKDPICLSTEPSCLLKESKYDITSNKKSESAKQIPDKNNQHDEETPNKCSSKSSRIKELIKENLLYSNYPTPNKKPKSIEIKKRKRRAEKDKILTKTKITLRCSKKTSKEKQLKLVAKLNENRNYNDEKSSVNQDDAPQCQNLTKLSINEVTGNEVCISFEEQKLPLVKSEEVFVEKSVVSSAANSELSNDIDSSKSTLINCEACSSITSDESKETVKELEIFVTSADDSGYLTREAGKNRTELTLASTNEGEGCSSNILKGFSSKRSDEECGIPKHKQTITEKISKWNQKDLVKLRVQLLFPYVYDDFELLEKARNTDLIKYYVESENNKLKQAIDSISQKEDMSIKSRSVISLPSVKMIPEEPNFSGDGVSEYSCRDQTGGFFNYQKFITQNNVCYSKNVFSKLNKSKVCGDCGDSFEEKGLSEICSVNSVNISSVKSSVSTKKSVIELFKLRSSSAKKSSCSMLSDNDTLVEENGVECLSMNNNISDDEFFNNFHQIMNLECQRYAKKVKDQSEFNESDNDELEYEEIPLDCLLKNKNLNVESSEDYLEQEFELASDEICSEINASNESIKKESNESFKSVTCIKPKTSTSKWQNLLKKNSSPGSNSKFSLDFYPQDKLSIIDMITNVQTSSVSEDSLICSPREKVLSVISSGEVTKQSEKQFFDNLLAFYDKESEFIKKLIRNDEFFSSIIENIRNSEDTTQLIFHKDVQKKMKKEKKKGIFSRFFRWKEKKSTETLFENPSIGKSLEFAKSISIENSSITRDSCYSFYKDFEDLERDINEAKHPNSEHLQQLALKAKCHLEPMVKATISNRHISDKIKLAGFLKMLDMVANGDFTFLNNGDNKTLEEKLREHVAQMFEKVYRIANREVVQKKAILDHDKIQLLKMLVTKYHMGIETHINILAIYIGRGLIVTRTQLEDAIIYLMGQGSQEINFEQLEKNCSIQSG